MMMMMMMIHDNPSLFEIKSSLSEIPGSPTLFELLGNPSLSEIPASPSYSEIPRNPFLYNIPRNSFLFKIPGYPSLSKIPGNPFLFHIPGKPSLPRIQKITHRLNRTYPKKPFPSNTFNNFFRKSLISDLRWKDLAKECIKQQMMMGTDNRVQIRRHGEFELQSH